MKLQEAWEEQARSWARWVREPGLVDFAREADPSMEVLVADAAALPLEDDAADLVVAFMSLHDIDDMPRAVREASRLLTAGGLFCLAIVHPLNSAGKFADERPDSPFVIAGNYLEPH